MVIKTVKMDSRILYIASRFFMGRVEWKNSSINEWVSFDLEPVVDIQFVSNKIIKHLGRGDYLLVLGRNNSGAFSLEKLLCQLNEILGKQNCCIWNEDLKKVIEFNRIGVLRIGDVQNKK